MWARICESAVLSAEAKEGFVDHTRDETVGDKGRNAIGPVGRNLW